MSKQSFSYAALYFPISQILLHIATEHHGINTNKLYGGTNQNNGEILLVELLQDQNWDIQLFHWWHQAVEMLS